MSKTPLSHPFAYLLDPDTIWYVSAELDPAVWDRTHEVFKALANIPYKGKLGIGGFYIVFMDPDRRDEYELMYADQLYERYITKYYNEEILLILGQK